MSRRFPNLVRGSGRPPTHGSEALNLFRKASRLKLKMTYMRDQIRRGRTPMGRMIKEYGLLNNWEMPYRFLSGIWNLSYLCRDRDIVRGVKC